MLDVTSGRSELRSRFPGWFGQHASTSDYFEAGLFVPDANVLLGCYRIGSDAREQLLGTLERQRDRLWVPHQSALEFTRNRRAVIPDQRKRHSEARDLVNNSLDRAVAALNDAVKALTDYRTAYIPKADWLPEQHRLAKNDIRTKLLDLLRPVNEELASIQNDHDVNHKDFADESKDPILARLSIILEGKVGPRYDQARVREIVRETIDFRFPNKIPPGYMDAKDKNALGAAGDVILWYQMIDRLRTGEGGFRKVVWITTDVKSDLWEVDKNHRAIKARPELIQEMYDETGAELLMVTLRSFLAGAKEFLHEDISDETLEQAEGLAAPDSYDVGQLTWSLMQRRGMGVNDLRIDQLAELVSRAFTNVGYTMVSLEVRGAGADIVLSRGDQKTVVAVRGAMYNLHKAMAGLIIAADAISATSKILIYTGSYTVNQLNRGLRAGIDMRDVDDVYDLLAGHKEDALGTGDFGL